HCIWTLPHNDDDFSSRWRDIKGCFSRTLKRQPLWQPRFWEHAIRDEDDYRRHVDYIHINPLKHGWVTRVIDWPFSTFHRDVQRGLYPPNWAGDSFDLSCGERR
ncbi:REP-associated tyrosine transposase, partial [Klebsiella pneumoniae]